MSWFPRSLIFIFILGRLHRATKQPQPRPCGGGSAPEQAADASAWVRPAIRRPSPATRRETPFHRHARSELIALAACLAHVRRKFHEARETAPKVAGWFLKHFQNVYQLETQLRDA